MSAFHDLSAKLKDALEGDSHSHHEESGVSISGTVQPLKEVETSDDLKNEERAQKKEGWSERVCPPTIPAVLIVFESLESWTKN